MKIISWNVNGIRSNIVDLNTSKYKKTRKLEVKSPLYEIINKYNPDIICFQETRLGKDLYDLFNDKSISNIFPYRYWSSSEGENHRSGNRYSGTSIWCKIEPNSIKYNIENLNDKEGRLIQIEYNNIIIITTYVPNSGSNREYRLNSWEPIITNYIFNLLKTDKIIVYCGDNNVANKNDVWFGNQLEYKFKTTINSDIKKNLKKKIQSKKSYHNGSKILCGYSKEERTAYNNMVTKCNLIDCYRHIYPTSINNFTWFNIRIKKSFENNKGWLIDRFLINSSHACKIKECKILKEIGIRNKSGIFISDHLPIYLNLNLIT